LCLKNQPKPKSEEEDASKKEDASSMMLNFESYSCKGVDTKEYKGWWISCVEEIDVALVLLYVCNRGVLITVRILDT